MFRPSLARRRDCYFRVLISALASSLLNLLAWNMAQAQVQSSGLNHYCQLSEEGINQVDTFRQTAFQGDEQAQQDYKTLIGQLANQLHDCRSRTWPQNQAIWLRLYPCDAQPGALDAIFDRIVSRGYNQVYVEVFHDGQVLLPSADNSTAWSSIVRSEGYENTDLFAEAIAKGHERGLKVYAWMFTLNFGYTYSLRPGADQVLARNGEGETSLVALAAGNPGTVNTDEVFIDPYSPQAKLDYYTLVQAILKRQPDGVLFDYIRYPLGHGADSVASRVQDLWIYGTAAQQALYARAQNQKGLDLIYRFLSQGRITASDIAAVNSLYPQEEVPLWQGRDSASSSTPERLQRELWQLSVAHAIQGILDFLAMAITPVQQKGIPSGAVFFPEANQQVGEQGYDSRLQPWERFPNDIEWHPMAYATCGNANCVVEQVKRVIGLASSGTQVKPVLAGTWGEVRDGHPSLESQMGAIYQAAPQIDTVSHFAYSWQEAQHDRQRKFCQL
ncbi:MAG: family 10 glycosylhydrolase [Cyanobacteria bacterium RU_5_0]|nr:family 10 glycosylhydrolase [Cyanobacteria bacterium RU_5_0]